jgi:hypothetical protein
VRPYGIGAHDGRGDEHSGRQRPERAPVHEAIVDVTSANRVKNDQTVILVGTGTESRVPTVMVQQRCVHPFG